MLRLGLLKDICLKLVRIEKINKIKQTEIMIDFRKVSDNDEVIKLIKERDLIEDKIRSIDNMALVRYEIEVLNDSDEQTKIN